MADSIHCIQPKDLNLPLYLDCIGSDSLAQPSLLNLSGNWEVWVANEYQAVMPVVYSPTFLGKKTGHLPLIHRLGIYGEYDPDLEKRFLSVLEKNYLIGYYAFSHLNTLPTLPRKSIQVLEINPYEKIRSAYSSMRKRHTRPVSGVDMIESLKLNEKLFQNHTPFLSKLQKKEIFNQISSLQDKKVLKSLSLLYSGKICAQIIYFESKTSIFLNCILSNRTILPHGMSLCIDYLIQKYSSTHHLDFFGSQLDGVKKFNLSFGAKDHSYPVIEQSKIKILKQFIKKRLGLATFANQ